MGDFLDPFGYLAGAAAKMVADSWTAAMVGLWNAGLWILRLAFTFTDLLLTPDLAEDGAGTNLYQTTFWIAGTLLLIMGMVQLGVAAFRRDGKSLARVAIGFAQFTVVWAGWLAYAAAVLAAAGGLTRALMSSLLHVDAFQAWEPWQPFTPADIVDGTVATVLGLLGLLLWLAAIGHFLVLLARAASLLVLVATTPIAAAGLVSDTGRAWFWKSMRWFHAAALAPVMMVLVLGVGVQYTSGVAVGDATTLTGAIGTAVPGVILICVATVSPLALFKLLSFVDPMTASGAAMRTTLAAVGGIQGALQGGGSSGSATDADAHGRSSGEDGAAAATSSRFTQATSQGLGVLGPLGGAIAGGLGVITAVGGTGASVGADLTNQMGVGHNTYPPDYAYASRHSHRAAHAAHAASDPGDPGGPPPGDDPVDFAPATNLSYGFPASSAPGASGAGGAGAGAAAAGEVSVADAAVVIL